LQNQTNEQLYKPIYTYLHGQYSKGIVERIMRNIMFIGEEHGQYCYKNKVTRGNIVLSSEGTVIHCAATALRTITDYPIAGSKMNNTKGYNYQSKPS